MCFAGNIKQATLSSFKETPVTSGISLFALIKGGATQIVAKYLPSSYRFFAQNIYKVFPDINYVFIDIQQCSSNEGRTLEIRKIFSSDSEIFALIDHVCSLRNLPSKVMRHFTSQYLNIQKYLTLATSRIKKRHVRKKSEMKGMTKHS